MAQLLNISADYLLDDGERISFQEIREPVSLEEYEAAGKCRDRRDAVCAAKHGDAARPAPAADRGPPDGCYKI